MMHSMFTRSLSHRQRLANVHCWRKAVVDEVLPLYAEMTAFKFGSRAGEDYGACFAPLQSCTDSPAGAHRRFDEPLWKLEG